MKKLIALLLAAMMVLGMLAACSQTPAADAPAADAPAADAPAADAPAADAPAADAPAAPALPAKITVGLMSGFQPYCYMNDDGTVGGFDAEVVTEAAKRLGIELEWLVVPWESLMVSLDADKCQIVSSQLWRTPERCAQYTMAKVPYE